MEISFTLPFLGFTLDVIGKLLVAWVTLRIHVKHFKKHRIKPADIQIDIWLSMLGIGLIIAGYFLRAPFEWNLTA